MHRSSPHSNTPPPVRRLFELVRNGGLAKLLTGPPRPVLLSNRRRLRQLSAADVDRLVRDYCDGAGSIYDLAKMYGVSHGTVSRRLKERGLELGHQPMTMSEIARARELYQEGLSFNAIGRALGRDPKTVKATLA